MKKGKSAAQVIVSYLSKRKTPATAAQIAEATGLTLKTVQNNLAPSGKLGAAEAVPVNTSGPFTFGYKLTPAAKAAVA
jgi:hypothetical protein